MSFMTELTRKWGENIRRTRNDQGLSIEALAARAGVDPGHLSRAERGLAGFGDESRIRLAAALGTRVESLFPYPDTETQCPSAASAMAGAASPTRPTTAETRSPAPSAEGQDGSDREESPANE